MIMLEYWMASNVSWANNSDYQLEDVLEDPGLAELFADYPRSLLYFAAGCCVLFMLIGIPGNLITVAALFRTKKLRNATAVFIMNLSVSDLMFCCFNLPLATSTFWHSAWLHGQLLCRLFPLLRYSLVAVSIFTVLAITINRYVMIGHPRLYPRLYKPKYLVLMLVAIWICGFGALVATWFGQWGRFGLDPAIGSCSILPDVHGRSPKEFLFILAFLTPCLAIIVCYARIFYIVRKTALRSRRNKLGKDQAKSNLEVKYTKGQNLEDSAIGSSCVATMTTENGSSPTRQDKLSFIGAASPRLSSSYQNFRQSSKFEYVAQCSPRLDGRHRRSSASSEQGSRKENGAKFVVNLRNSSVNLSGMRSEYKNDSGKSQSVSFGLAEDAKNRDRENGGTPGNPLTDTKKNTTGVFSVSNNNLTDRDKESKSSLEERDDEIPFMDSNVQGRNGEPETPTGKNPKPRLFDTRPQIRFEEVYVEAHGDNQNIINAESVGDDQRSRRFEVNSLQVPRRFQGIQNSSESLLTSQMSRYDEISEDFVSSRSDSPSEKRSGKKSNVIRRESRFRSVRTRQFETGKLTTKDKKLLKMIMVIFVSFLICYLPITITKTFKDMVDWRGLNIAGYILIYLTTCINPIIYVVMSSEYRSAYKNVLLCRSDSVSGKPNSAPVLHEKKKSTLK
ncbi:G-protein coupled receptor moody isoform X1 [Neodiprion fabricii]|uniref:G-protein coupled receptor moody isoform X1 n=2 Tax=Neodiprion fabricii TaxID=2872261 RepID=UPI001ED8EC00|nr:G-protein coupled receptor moody isoform X1 [Neodiprion fabricii]